MAERNVTSLPVSPPLTTPLVWAWGGVLLTATTWLVGIVALFRSIGGLFG
ncbi:hypothetical protein JMJ56_06020 [Belnapia sp. T18]|uniref:DUF2474 domain-containing protein n=1 Tax=Belnapia arida TaxID=2804533 RepID=A0ABS1U1H4_9PROT|nr:hypothetical protein [Belnapia arida]MBL6077557.1 hypothetical protein [Belnapia arida]